MASRANQSTSKLAELTSLVDRYTDAKRENRLYATAISGVSTLRSDPLMQSVQCMIKPSLCITVQGEKAATFGSNFYEYRAGYGLVVTAEMPERGTVCALSKGNPYLGLVFELNLQELQELVERSAEARTHARGKVAGPFTFELNCELLDCALRTVRLFEMPDAIPVLYPGIMREILLLAPERRGWGSAPARHHHGERSKPQSHAGHPTPSRSLSRACPC